jgi:flagellar biosynthesis protein FlhG
MEGWNEGAVVKKRRLGRGLAELAASPGAAEAASLGRMRSAAANGRRPWIVCVSSGKGGTGKSIVTSNLSVHIASSGLKLLSVDADMGLANLHLLFGLRPGRTIFDVIERGASLAEIVETGHGGVQLAAGGSGITEMADLHPERLLRLVVALEAAGGIADVILVDTGAGIGRATTSFLYSVRDVLIVTTPDLTAMTDAYAVIKNVARNNRRARVFLVVNRTSSAVEGMQIFARMDQISRKFLGRSLHYLGHILDDPRVPASVAACKPILLHQPASPAAACLRGIGRSLMLEMRGQGESLEARSGAEWAT